jgi:hypothetical protein
MLRLFMTLKSPVYEKTIALALVHLIYLETVNHPVFSMFRNNVTVFNEEMGEILISVLARHGLTDTHKFDPDQINEKWRLIQPIRDTLAQFEHDYNIKTAADEEAVSISSIQVLPDSPEVTRLSAFFSTFIISVCRNEAKQYRLINSKSSYGHQSDEVARLQPCVMKRVLREISVTDLNTLFDKSCQSLTRKHYDQTIQDLIDHKTQSVDIINPLFEEDLGDFNPAVGGIEYSADIPSPIRQPNFDTDQINPLESVFSSVSDEFPLLPDCPSNDSINRTDVVIAPSQAPRPKPKRARLVADPESESSDNDSNSSDFSPKQSLPKRPRLLSKKPKDIHQLSNPASTVLNNGQSVGSTDVTTQIGRSDSSDTESFVQRLTTHCADKSGFVFYDQNTHNRRNRSRAEPERPSCRYCPSFGDYQCTEKFCRKCCLKYAKTHPKYECSYHLDDDDDSDSKYQVNN